MSDREALRRENAALREELREARATTIALRDNEVDSIFDEASRSHVMLAEAQRALRESEALLRAIFDGALDGIVIVDDRGRYVDANPAACELLGRSREELLRLSIAEVSVSEPSHTETTFDAFVRRGTMSGQYTLRRGDGSTVDVEYRATANILPGRHLSILRDVTERNELQRQLVQSQKLEAVGRLAGGIAHDFNNVLSAITGFATLVRQQLPDAHPATDDLDEIVGASERAGNLTRQLLVFSRRQPSRHEPVDLNEVIGQLSRLLERIIGADVELNLELQPRIDPIRGDVGHLEQIVMNLVINAREAMPTGGKLLVATRQKGPGGERVELCVRDSGEGMDAATRERLFEPFFTTKATGSGLGLSIVYGLVQQMAGTIEVESSPGHGTTFTLQFPAVRQTSGSVHVRKAPVRPAGGHETILLVEDEAVVRKLVAKILGRAGYDVVPAANAGEAVLYMELHGDDVDLVLSDMVMPMMNGPELITRLRQVRPRRLKTLFMSGYPPDADGRDEHSGIRILAKPFQPEQLLRAVREALDTKGDEPDE